MNLISINRQANVLSFGLAVVVILFGTLFRINSPIIDFCQFAFYATVLIGSGTGMVIAKQSNNKPAFWWDAIWFGLFTALFLSRYTTLFQ